MSLAWSGSDQLARDCARAAHRCPLCKQFGHYLSECPGATHFDGWTFHPVPEPKPPRLYLDCERAVRWAKFQQALECAFFVLFMLTLFFCAGYGLGRWAGELLR